MVDRLAEYRKKRDPNRTPEPIPAGPVPAGNDDTFVIQQHHARALHWDLRLERDGVLVSWAVPRGLPHDPKDNHLAVHTEDHPLEYSAFHGDIPAGEYGGGNMRIFDRGRYVTEKWRDDEVIVVLDGTRVRGRFVLFQTRGKDWMIHRMDGLEPGWTPVPDGLTPMRATDRKRLPTDDGSWAYEMCWPGDRALAFVSGGRLDLAARSAPAPQVPAAQAPPKEAAEGAPERGRRRIGGRNRESFRGTALSRAYPELRAMAESLAPIECVLDGVVVAFDASGRLSVDALRARPDAPPRKKAPIQYVVFDLLWLDGVSTMDLPYPERRELLENLPLSGTAWQVPPYFPGGGGHAREAARAQGLPGLVAKRLDSVYQPGETVTGWVRVPL
jgi:bifunctional non-homologous end joining protein LigD